MASQSLKISRKKLTSLERQFMKNMKNLPFNPLNLPRSMQDVMNLIQNNSGENPNMKYPLEVEPLLEEFAGLLGATNFRRVRALPGPKGRWGICAHNVAQKVEEFGGEVVYGLLISICNIGVRGSYHVIWKHKGQYLDVTELPRGIPNTYLLLEIEQPPLDVLSGAVGLFPKDSIMFVNGK